MKTNIKTIFEIWEKNATKIYLISVNLILTVFAIWFSNAGLLPFANTSDFLVFAVLGLILALYRPSWTFAFFVGTLALENINLGSKNFGITVRPYQFFAFLTIFSLAVQAFSRRLSFSFPKWKWYDLLLILFAASGFLSSFKALNRGVSFKQSIIALSFVAIYFLVRIYIQSLQDLKRIMPFFLASSFVVLGYAIWQNVRFLHGASGFEVMPGRPNGTFTEPDWFGIYLVFLLSVLYTIIYHLDKKIKTFNFKLSIYVILSLVFIVLILTVSRSAWLGAIIVTIGFWKIILTNGSLKIFQWKWKKLLLSVAFVIVSVGISAGFALMLTRFQISNRAVSTGGLQKITISCEQNHPVVPQMINNISELSQYNCQFINLEDIAAEKAQGRDVIEVFRPDPTVNIRSQIYQKSLAEIKAHPFFGIGWGNISQILGTDERGAGLNASNIFFEIYLGSGLLGFLSFVILLVWILIVSIKEYLSCKEVDKTVAVFVLLGWVAMVIPNLFNSGIFLGFLWVYLAVAVSLLNKKN